MSCTVFTAFISLDLDDNRGEARSQAASDLEKIPASDIGPGLETNKQKEERSIFVLHFRNTGVLCQYTIKQQQQSVDPNSTPSRSRTDDSPEPTALLVEEDDGRTNERKKKHFH